MALLFPDILRALRCGCATRCGFRECVRCSIPWGFRIRGGAEEVRRGAQCLFSLAAAAAAAAWLLGLLTLSGFVVFCTWGFLGSDSDRWVLALAWEGALEGKLCRPSKLLFLAYIGVRVLQEGTTRGSGAVWGRSSQLHMFKLTLCL